MANERQRISIDDQQSINQMLETERLMTRPEPSDAFLFELEMLGDNDEALEKLKNELRALLVKGEKGFELFFILIMESLQVEEAEEKKLYKEFFESTETLQKKFEAEEIKELEKMMEERGFDPQYYPIVKRAYALAVFFKRNPDLFTNDLMRHTIECHKKKFAFQNSKFQKQIPKLKEGFIEQITTLCQALGIPLDERKKYLFSILSCELHDASLNIAKSGFLASGYNFHRIRILHRFFMEASETCSPFNEKTRREAMQEYMFVLYHEFLHAISGKALIQEEAGKEDGHPLVIVEEQKSGLTFKKEGIGQLRFTFLNEAVTESLTLLLIKTMGNEHYAKEIKLFKLLCENGSIKIDKKIFFAAYFEDFDPSLPEGQRIPHWKALWKAINNAYEPGFLVKLDRFVQEKGIEAAIQAMEKDWHTI